MTWSNGGTGARGGAPEGTYSSAPRSANAFGPSPEFEVDGSSNRGFAAAVAGWPAGHARVGVVDRRRLPGQAQVALIRRGESRVRLDRARVLAGGRAVRREAGVVRRAEADRRAATGIPEQVVVGGEADGGGRVDVQVVAEADEPVHGGDAVAHAGVGGTAVEAEAVAEVTVGDVADVQRAVGPQVVKAVGAVVPRPVLQRAQSVDSCTCSPCRRCREPGCAGSGCAERRSRRCRTTGWASGCGTTRCPGRCTRSSRGQRDAAPEVVGGHVAADEHVHRRVRLDAVAERERGRVVRDRAALAARSARCRSPRCAWS